jgi:hypothetical protein
MEKFFMVALSKDTTTITTTTSSKATAHADCPHLDVSISSEWLTKKKRREQKVLSFSCLTNFPTQAKSFKEEIHK